jgi:hypothetical protein
MNIKSHLVAILNLMQREFSSFLLLILIFFLGSSLKIITLFFLPLLINMSIFYLIKKGNSLLRRDFITFMQQNFLRLFIGQLFLYGLILSFILAFFMIILAVKGNDLILTFIMPLLILITLLVVVRLSLTSFYLLDNVSMTYLEAIRASYNNPNRRILYQISLGGLAIIFLTAFLNFPLLAFVVELITKALLVKIFFTHDQ